MTKLTEDQVREIIATREYHGSGARLARKFGVSRQTVSAVRRGHRFKAILPKCRRYKSRADSLMGQTLSQSYS
jgi:DNA-binding XRE family transcriptional regulator